MDLLDRLLGHDAWTTRQLLLLCRDLTDEQLDREFDIGHRSVRATFLHIIRNVEIWSDLMAGRAAAVDESTQPRGRSVFDLLARLDCAAMALAEVSRAVAQRDEWDEQWLDPLDGNEKTYGGGIAHVITHSMHHRAQLLYLLRRLGVQRLPEGDVLSWEREAGVPIRTFGGIDDFGDFPTANGAAFGQNGADLLPTGRDAFERRETMQQVQEMVRCQQCGSDDLQLLQMDFLQRHRRAMTALEMNPDRLATRVDFRCNDCGCEFQSLRLPAR
jgi:uncharacterized damage-inducible protein DinB